MYCNYAILVPKIRIAPSGSPGIPNVTIRFLCCHPNFYVKNLLGTPETELTFCEASLTLNVDSVPCVMRVIVTFGILGTQLAQLKLRGVIFAQS